MNRVDSLKTSATPRLHLPAATAMPAAGLPTSILSTLTGLAEVNEK